jgi:hypothetical protein
MCCTGMRGVAGKCRSTVDAGVQVARRNISVLSLGLFTNFPIWSSVHPKADVLVAGAAQLVQWMHHSAKAASPHYWRQKVRTCSSGISHLAPRYLYTAVVYGLASEINRPPCRILRGLFRLTCEQPAPRHQQERNPQHLLLESRRRKLSWPT